MFTYANPPQLAAGPGDLVRVRLKGRAHTGLVVGTAFERPPELGERTARALDSILQKAAVDPHWRNLIEAVAQDCHCSLFRCLRSCLPPGWLGHRPQRQASGNGGAWIQISLIEGDNAPREAPGLINQRPTSRQLDLLKHLTALGGKQLLRDLVRDGFSRGLVASTESGGWIRRDLVTATAAGSRRRGHGAQTEADPAPETPRPANPAQAAAIEIGRAHV